MEIIKPRSYDDGSEPSQSELFLDFTPDSMNNGLLV